VPDRPLVRRRTALTGALGGVAVMVLANGCDHGDDIGEPASSASPSVGTSSASAPEQTPDEALVDQVLAGLGTALTVVVHARKSPVLRQQLLPLLRAHRRHVDVLDGQPPVAPPGPATDPAASLRAVRRSEVQLQAALVDAAGRAESGALAKLLASMSASVTQHLAVLPRTVGG
jgi:hypothetical protein